MVKRIKSKRILVWGVLIFFVTLFCAWKEIPRTFSQLFPEYKEAESFQIIHVGMDDAEDFDFWLEGKSLQELLTWLEQWRLYPDHKKVSGGTEMLEGYVCHLIFYSGNGELGQVDITDSGVFSGKTWFYNHRVRDETFFQSWRTLLDGYVAIETEVETEGQFFCPD